VARMPWKEAHRSVGSRRRWMAVNINVAIKVDRSPPCGARDNLKMSLVFR
jgi:hypothetical protein